MRKYSNVDTRQKCACKIITNWIPVGFYSEKGRNNWLQMVYRNKKGILLGMIKVWAWVPGTSSLLTVVFVWEIQTLISWIFKENIRIGSTIFFIPHKSHKFQGGKIWSESKKSSDPSINPSDLSKFKLDHIQYEPDLTPSDLRSNNLQSDWN
jgi:hypothetical protein